MAVFNFISDDSHGWMEVSLIEFPEAVNYGSGFGYINGNTIYLEEDDEAENFIYHLRSQGEPITFIEKVYDGQWFGRAYARNVRGI
ncbi:MAG: hypothetical protein EBR82_71635, partial [Caulobacteraceae bacterium]|nr:hypothetical protein [Caulobacteraceae bacterium]